MPNPTLAFAVGLIFGLGLTVSQMINPAKVQGFLDLFGAWDPSLLLVMGGALTVTFIGYRVVLGQPKPLLDERFRVPANRTPDRRLIAGAAMFGIGWGLVGYCPGPALAGLGLGNWQTLLFVAAMFAGMGLFELFNRLTKHETTPGGEAMAPK